MPSQTDTIQVSGVRCERCVQRLAATLEGHAGLEFATANLIGEVTLTWDDERTDRGALLAALAEGGFHQLTPPNPAVPMEPATTDRASSPPIR